MEPEFWQERWQRDQIGFHQKEVNPQLREYWPRVGALAGARIFVPLCGKSRDILWFARNGYEVVGVELSPIAAEAFFRENDLIPDIVEHDHHTSFSNGAVNILCGDFFALRPADLKGVSVVYDRASLIALPADLRRRYVAHLKHLLDPQARTLLVTLEYPDEHVQGPPFSVGETEVRALYDDTYTLENLAQRDVLAANPHLRDKGISALIEKSYLLCPRTSSKRA